MDVFSIRRDNLEQLVAHIKAARPGRLQRDIAADLGDLGASYLSQLVNGKRMGEDVARKIEAARSLPHGWMDLPHHAIAEGSAVYASHHLRIDPETIAAALQLVRLSFLNLGLEIDQEENGEPLADAYDFLMARHERAVTAENLLEFKPRLQALIGGRNATVESAGDRQARSVAG